MFRQNILGVHISAINMPQALETIAEWIQARTPNYVTVTPAHGVMDGVNDPEIKAIFNASGLTTPDGMAIVWLLKAYGHAHVDRVYGPDLLLAACQYGIERGWTHYFYGGAPDVGEQLVDVLKEKFPGLKVVGIHSPPYRPLTPEEDAAEVEMIQQADPDIVWVGLSTPKQERWMAAHVKKLHVPALIGIGAAFDFISGNKPQAPRWIQRSGFEWLYRLLSEPARLWPRYRQYPRFVWLVLNQYLGTKKY